MWKAIFLHDFFFQFFCLLYLLFIDFPENEKHEYRKQHKK